MSDWSDELKAEVIQRYVDEINEFPEDKRGENSAAVVAAIAEDIGRTPNAVRVIISKSGKYVTKTASRASGAAKEKAEGSKRVSKADAIAELTSAITDAGQEVDSEILDKLTGKAAAYFSGVIRGISTN